MLDAASRFLVSVRGAVSFALHNAARRRASVRRLITPKSETAAGAHVRESCRRASRHKDEGHRTPAGRRAVTRHTAPRGGAARRNAARQCSAGKANRGGGRAGRAVRDLAGLAGPPRDLVHLVRYLLLANQPAPHTGTPSPPAPPPRGHHVPGIRCRPSEGGQQRRAGGGGGRKVEAGGWRRLRGRTGRRI